MELDYIIQHDHLIKPPNNKTKIVSLFAIVFFLIALVVGGYITSYDKDKISQDDFTISRALEYGDRYVLVIFFLLSFILLIYLNHLRSKNFFYKTRLTILTAVYICLITIIWVTVSKNKDLHYAFAGIIFTLNIVYLFCISYMFNEYLIKNYKYLRYILDLVIALTIVTWVSLLVFGIGASDNKDLIADEEIFAISENFTILLTSLPIIFLGFI
tara:strand:+ start:816 stop:1457 length:642 start_codon:yes stop_codon:yes gene_type:complete